MALLWSYSDQQGIKPISANNEPKWEQLAIEVQYAKLKDMMGADFYQDVINNPATTWNAKLIDGGTYTKGTITYEFAGLKTVLSFLLYSRYIIEINAQDTYAGFMQNENPNAQHISFGQKKDLKSTMNVQAEKHWADCRDFVCENSTEFPYAKFTTSGNFYFM